MKSNLLANIPTLRQRKAGGCSLLVMGLVFAVVGACVVWFLGSDITLNCLRSKNSCILGKTGVLGRKEVVASIPLSRVKSAEVESRKGGSTTNGNRRKATYQVVLHTDDGPIPFSNVRTSDREAHRQTASEINAYLASSRESLAVVQSGKTVRLIGWLFLAVGGLAFLSGLRGVFGIFRTLGSVIAARG